MMQWPQVLKSDPVKARRRNKDVFVALVELMWYLHVDVERLQSAC